MTATTYKGYSIEAYEREPSRWFARFRRLDGRVIETGRGPRQSRETSAAMHSRDDAIAYAKEAIDGMKWV